MLHWEGCEVTLLVGTRVCIGWLRSILREIKESVNSSTRVFLFPSMHCSPQLSILGELVVYVSLVCVLQRSGVGLGEHHGVTVEWHRQTQVSLNGRAYC